jgi:hypothetical protein
MDTHASIQVVELRVGARYVNEHPWIVQAMTGFLSAYFMAHPGFRVQRHVQEQDSGMHVWLCEVPSTMNMRNLVKRLQADIPPCRCIQTVVEPAGVPQFVIDIPTEADGK